MHIHPTLRILAFCVHKFRYNVVAENCIIEYLTIFFCLFVRLFLMTVFLKCKLKFYLDCDGFHSIPIGPVLRQGPSVS